ncbi:MAG: transglycosylase SLT domain-containing protein, partial [Bacteriovoracaceae bacterium]
MDILKSFSAALAMFFTLSCAGPNSPFGAPALTGVSVNPEFKTRISSSSKPSAKITSFPGSQLYHSPFDLVLQVHDEKNIPRNFHYEILYNGKKIERWWSNEKIVFDPANPKLANIIFERLSLLPGRANKISFLYYRDKNSAPITYDFNPPRCPFRDGREIANINPFKSEEVSLSKIEEVALKAKINPSLLAALVAQESSFNPLAISWAKALGLTQVTSLASKEILALRPHWQYDKSVEKLNYIQLKTRILSNKLTKAHDWRLDQAKSLEGGSIYLNLLRRYWQKEHSAQALAGNFPAETPLTDILLASYNS